MKDTSLLSLIDVISCGLGAVVLLFLIFAALPHMDSGSSTGERQEEGESPSSRLPRGSPERRPGRHATPSLRVVELRGPAAELGGVWSAVEEGCRQYRMTSRDAQAFVVSCPEGFNPDQKLRFSSRNHTAGTLVRAMAIDGEDLFPSEPKSSPCLEQDLTVEFDFHGRPEVRVCGSVQQ